MSPLDNPVWSALTTHHAHLAVGGDRARRYPDEVAPIAGVARRDPRAVDELQAVVTPGDWISLPATLPDLTPLFHPRFTVTISRMLVQMVCERRVDVPPGDVEVRVLSESDAPDMLELATLTRPGPFKPRTFTLGLYLGIRVDGVLAAMGGQRMH